MAGAGKVKAEPREVELKLDGEPDAIEGLRDHPIVRHGAASTERLSAVYFDTDDCALRAAGISLRIRRSGNGNIQTIKAARGAGLALDRSEWDHPVADGSLDLSAAAGTALEPLLADERVRATLRPRFTVEVDRTAVTVRHDGSALELALDRGTVFADGAAQPLAEVELELKGGDPAALFGVARTLAEAAPLRLGFKAKSERGYDLLSGEKPKPTKAEPIRLSAEMTSGDAFQAIGRSCLRQYVANEAVLRAERNPDAVHQMRVALRRLRAAATLFKDATADGEQDAVRGELKRMANELGPARDLDVFIAETVRPALERHGDDPAFATLLADYEERREAAYERALAAVACGDLARSALRAAAWIEAGDWLGSRAVRAARDRAVEAHAAAELDRRWRKVRRRTRGLRRLAPEARHEVRIEIKKLRYAAEFFAALFEGPGRAKERKVALSTLAALQEVLGNLNDIAVAAAEPATGALASLQAEQVARVEPLLAEAKGAVRALREVEPFWRG